MGSFGNEFVDVTNPGPLRTPVPSNGVYPINREITELQRQLFSGQQSRWPRGAVLYFPPGRYRVADPRAPGQVSLAALDPAIKVPKKGSNGDGLIELSLHQGALDPRSAQPGVPRAPSADLFFNSAFTLHFAPGAVLVLDDEVLVDIQGDLEAPLSQIFELGLQARVIFGTSNVLRVAPEWWGARSGDLTVDSTASLQSCLDAAVLRFSSVGGSPLPPVTVVLGGPYAVSGELILGREETIRRRLYPPSSASVQLLARQVFRGGGPDRATLVASRGASPFSSMLRIGWDVTSSALSGSVPAGVLARGVSFQANGVADACLWLGTGGSLDDRFEDCAFRGARKWLVLAGRSLAFDARRVPTLSGIDLSRLRFIDCAFDMRQQAPSPERVPTGLYFRADNTLPLEVEGCSFEGPASAMILGHGGVCRVRTTYFRNTSNVNLDPRSMAAAEGLPSDLVQTSVPRGGVDLYIARPEPTTGPGTSSPTGFLIDRCVSRSGQFLATYVGPAEVRTHFWPTMIRGLRHDPPPQVRAPAVSWVGPGLQETGGCSLAMSNCSLAPVRDASNQSTGGVLLGRPSRRLLEVGNRRRDGRPLVTVGPETRPVAARTEEPLLRDLRVRIMRPG